MPQNEDVDWNFPVLVEDVVMMGRYGHMNMLRIPKMRDHEAVASALERVGMGDFRKRQIGELSGGQKKRVFLARALAQDGQVILLDEPFTGVDVKTEDAIIELLRSLRDEGRVMLVSTHNLGSVPEFCDRTILINRTVLAYGPTAQVFTQENLEKLSAACFVMSFWAAATGSISSATTSDRSCCPRMGGRGGDDGSSPGTFTYGYMVNAMWVSALVGGVCAFLSVYLMLKGWSLIGDALSHSIVPGVAGAYMLGLPFSIGAFFSGGLAAAAMLF